MLTITSKAGLGFALMFFGNFLKNNTQSDSAAFEATLYQEGVTVADFEFLQANSSGDFIVKSGQVLLIDASVDLSKILAGFAAKFYRGITQESNCRKTMALISEIDDELKQKLNAKKKHSRKNKAVLDQLTTKREKLQEDLWNISRNEADINPKFYFYVNFTVEILASLYLLISFMESLNLLLGKSDMNNPSLFDDSAEQIGNNYLDYTNASPLTYLLNKFLSPKLSLVIASLQIILNNIDLTKIQSSKLLSNIPIVALLNSLGFKFISLTAIYDVSRKTLVMKGWMRLITRLIENPCLFETNVLTSDEYTKHYERLLKLGRSNAKAVEEAQQAIFPMVQKMHDKVQKVANIKDLFLFMTRGINIYGNFKFYKNWLHIIDNILDIMERRALVPVLIPKPQTEKIAARLSKAENSIKKLYQESKEAKKIASPQPAAIKTFSSHKPAAFPEEMVRQKPKIKTKGQAAPSNIESRAELNSESPVDELKLNAEDLDRKKRRDEVLTCYPYCDRNLLRTILKPEKNVHLSIEENEILMLARDLKLDHRKTESGYLIQVYKRYGATFHSIHGRDGSGKIKSFFISDLAKAFNEIGITIDALNEIDEELDKQSCFQGGAINILTYVLTERPKTESRKFR